MEHLYHKQGDKLKFQNPFELISAHLLPKCMQGLLLQIIKICTSFFFHFQVDASENYWRDLSLIFHNQSNE